MSYEPTNWKKGDKVTSTKLNKIKQGIKGNEDGLGQLTEEIDSLPEVKNPIGNNADLYISDESGNVVVKFADGHIKTKNFDSSDIDAGSGSLNVDVKTTNENGFYLSDQQGNALAKFSDGQIKTKNFDSAGIQPIIITVKKDNTGDFTSIRDAIDSIKDANSKTKPYVIEIYKGTYNVFDNYTHEEILTAGEGAYIQDGSGFVGILLTDGISLKGVGDRDEIILHGELNADTYSSTLRNNVSTLNTKDSLSIENITVTARNIRYCVHDDFNPTFPYVERHVKNCKFRGYNLTSGTDTRTWGEGASQGKTTILEDCDFGTAIGWHSSDLASATRPSILIVKNCTALIAEIFCYNHSVKNNVHLYNNNFSIVTMSFSNGSSTDYMMEVDGTGKGAMTLAPTNWNYTNGDIERFRRNGTQNFSVGQLVIPSASPFWASGSLATITNPTVAYGVIVGYDSEWFYVQKDGYIDVARFGFSNLTIGDKITAKSDGTLEVNGTGETFGIVCCVTNNYGTYIRRIA